jgi:hypothetical protein
MVPVLNERHFFWVPYRRIASKKLNSNSTGTATSSILSTGNDLYHDSSQKGDVVCTYITLVAILNNGVHKNDKKMTKTNKNYRYLVM